MKITLSKDRHAQTTFALPLTQPCTACRWRSCVALFTTSVSWLLMGFPIRCPFILIPFSWVCLTIAPESQYLRTLVAFSKPCCVLLYQSLLGVSAQRVSMYAQDVASFCNWITACGYYVGFAWRNHITKCFLRVLILATYPPTPHVLIQCPYWSLSRHTW